MADEATIQRWLAALDSDDLDSRIDAINRLGEAKAAVAVLKLIELLGDAEFSVQMAAVDALGQIGDDRAIPALAKIAQGEPGPLQSQAATALFVIHTPDALAAIDHLRTDDDEYGLGAAEPAPEEAAEAPDSGADAPDFDNMSPLELMDWMEDLARRQGAGEGLTTEADLEIPEVEFEDDSSDRFGDGLADEKSTGREEPKPQAPPAPAPSVAPPGAPEPERKRRLSEEVASGSSPTLSRDTNLPLEEAIGEAQSVQFSAYYPREVRPNEWQPLHAYVFKKLAEDKVADDAEKALGPLDAFRRIVERARHTIAEGEMITATPTLPGFQFNPPSVTIGFYEDWHRLAFKLRAHDAPLNQAANGFLTFMANGLIVADVPLSVFVTNEVTQPQPQASETHAIYDTVFASYSHRDTQIVERVETAAKTLGLTYLRDVITLRSGEDWSDQLMVLIDQATIFQLFWSAESAKSPHCRMEWEYAVKLDRQAQHFIRPVYWAQPMAPPPSPLQHIHFAYLPDLVN